MTYESFTEEILKEVCKILPDDLPAVLRKVTKNNGTELTAVTLDGEAFLKCASVRNVAPIIYLEDFYESWQDGTPLQELAGRAAEILMMPAVKLDAEYMTSLDYARSHVVPRLISRLENSSLLENAVYRPFLDLAVVYGIMLEDEVLGNGLITVDRRMLESWQISEEELYSLSVKNAETILGDDLMDMRRIFEPLAGEKMQMPMYVLSNTRQYMGAAALLYSKKPGLLARELGCDLFILPSSVHETILLPADGVDPDCCREIVGQVNRQEVKREEQLSYEIYRYSKSDGTLKIV